MRLTELSLTFALGVGLGLLASSSCGPTTCTALTCPNGCCSNNACVAGTEASACGKKGNACTSCSGTSQCVAQVCKADGGTGGGGGSGGGTQGTGGGGGSAVLCRSVVTFPVNDLLIADYWPFTSSPGHYNLVRWVMPGNTPGNSDTIDLEITYANDVGPTAPFMGTITDATYSNCSLCSLYFENCNASHDCQRTYLARSGNMNVTRADRAVAGRMQASADTLVYQDWNMQEDRAASEACLTVAQVPMFVVGWNQDGGAAPP